MLDIVEFEGILAKGPYPPCLRMADRTLLAGYPRIRVQHTSTKSCWHTSYDDITVAKERHRLLEKYLENALLLGKGCRVVQRGTLT